MQAPLGQKRVQQWSLTASPQQSVISLTSMSLTVAALLQPVKRTTGPRNVLHLLGQILMKHSTVGSDVHCGLNPAEHLLMLELGLRQVRGQVQTGCNRVWRHQP